MDFVFQKKKIFFSDEPRFIWRVPDNVIHEADMNKLVDAITREIDHGYPDHAPWKCLRKDKDGHTRLFFQVYKHAGVQPVHLDSGLGWYKMKGKSKPYSGIAVCFAANDGPSTQIYKEPFQSLFEAIARMASKNPKNAKKFFEEQLPIYDKWMDEHYGCDPSGWIRSRAGQMLCFHPGEQIHRGVGWDGEPDPLHENFEGRIVLFLEFWPEETFEEAKDLNLVSQKSPGA